MTEKKKRFTVPSLTEACLEVLDEETKTTIFLQRDSYLGLYWNLIAVEFFRTWPEHNQGYIDERLIESLEDPALDIIFEHREKHPFLYKITIERLFWETFFMW
jgi:hypothetical protein